MMRQQFEGCFLGLALGDTFGAPHEGGMIEQALWRLIGKTKEGQWRWTDDTQMSLDMAESLIEHRRWKADDVATRFANSYHWTRGYGPGASKVLKSIRSGTHWRVANRAVYPQGSYGNGAAMRAPIIALAFAHRGALAVQKASKLSASITHTHPQGQQGAVLIALSTWFLLKQLQPRDVMAALLKVFEGDKFEPRLKIAAQWVKEKADIDDKMIRKQLGVGITALNSCVTAVYLSLRYLDQSFDELLRATIRLGGDVDTIAAMAGAMWGAARGSKELPKDKLMQLEDFSRVRKAANQLYDMYQRQSTSSDAAAQIMKV